MQRMCYVLVRIHHNRQQGKPSTLRQIPDTQEVYLYPDSNVSIIVEIVESVEPNHPHDAAKFHFDALAHDNSALSSHVENVTVIKNDRGDGTPSPMVLKGTQNVPKFNRTNVDNVAILLAVYRVEGKRVDVVLSMNIPLLADDHGEAKPEQVETAKAAFDTAVRSLSIIDFGLFA
ncbi:hypothetical protein EVG20_g3375 [Dentipellis fragilis]|uniref:Mog1p/PsbP-like protein n=1 Tax=Dentipellis fragilis TaxID=205917 RepID=A0A4Y9Z4Y1_9AGAM|nr:hypothetical protein EVG20_g3375 [Dentipellis fragilis]